MWWISVRDVQWRRRRFAIAVVGAAMVFALALLIAGISEGFRLEARNTVGGVGGDGFVMDDGASGPTTSVATLRGSMAADLARTPGVRRAQPVVMIRSSVAGKPVLLVGHVPDGHGSPRLSEGRAATSAAEIVVDRRFDARVGDRVVLGDASLEVVGETRGMTIQSGIPALYVTIERAQATAFGGADFATAIVVDGRPEQLPAGTRLIAPDAARDDALAPMREAIDAIDLLRVLLWVVAAVIIGSIIYLSALERVRDFAVLKAVGASSRALITGLMIQSTLLSIVASVLAAGLVQLIIPVFPIPVSITATSTLLLPAIAVVVGIAASLAGVRRAVAADPAMAFAAS